MSEPVVITLPWIPPAILRGNSRAHHMVKYRAAKELRESGYFSTRPTSFHGAFRKQMSKAHVTYEFHNWRPIDLDNLAIGMKPWIDGAIVDTGIVPDDSPDHVVYGEHTFTKCKKGSEKTIVTIEEVLQ